MEESTAELYKLPETGDVTVELVSDISDLDFTLALFPMSEVATISPQSLEFRLVSASASVVVLDDRTARPGESVTFSPEEVGLGGATVALMIIPSNTVESFLSNGHRYTPQGNETDGDTKRQPLYSLNSANPGGLDQVMTITNSSETLLMIQDLTRYDSGEGRAIGGDTFDQINVRITPALEMVEYHGGNYYQASVDQTIDWDGEDGYTGEQKGDF